METYAEYLKGLWRPPIQPKDPDGLICLNHNEAPFSGAESFTVRLDSLNLYPDPFHLYQKLARFHGVEMEQLLLTCGSEQALRYVFDTYLDFGDRVVMPDPTFGMMEVFCYYNRADLHTIEYDDDRRIDLETLIEAIDEKTRLFFLANPDNPTGTALPLDAIERIASRCCEQETVFLLDEAYHGYYSLPTIDLCERFPCLVIARSFSKSWGLAGIRAGYLVSNRDAIDLLRKQKPMDELNSLTIEICEQALDHPEIVERNRAQVQKWKAVFRQKPWNTLRYLESEGNFILLQSADYERHLEAFEKQRILPRTFKERCLKNCIRFSVAPDEVMERIADLLDRADAR